MNMNDVLRQAATRTSPSIMEQWTGRIHQGDCVETMNRLPPESVDLIVTSPPYNIKNSTGNGLKNGSGGKWPKAELIKGYASHDDAMPHDQYVEWQRECLRAMMRVLRKDGAIFYNHKAQGATGAPPGQARHRRWLSCATDHHLAAQRRNQFQRRLFSSYLRSYLSDCKTRFPSCAESKQVRRCVEDSPGVQQSPPCRLPC